MPDGANGQPRQEFAVPLADGATIVVSVHGDGPRMVVSHGNGFAVEAYRPFWSRLAERYEVVTFSQRHHGRNSPYRTPVRNVPQFVSDLDVVLAAIEERLGAKETYGAFHSLSAIVSLIHAATRPSPWRALVAFEPPLPPPADTDLSERFRRFNGGLTENALRRRETFSDPSELAATFAKHGAFARVPHETRLALAAATLRPRASGGFELSCAREFEAETFRLHGAERAWADVVRLAIPLCLVASDPAGNAGACLVEIAQRLAAEGGFPCRVVPGTTHFLQLEEPAACAAIVEAFIASLDRARPEEPAALDRQSLRREIRVRSV